MDPSQRPTSNNPPNPYGQPQAPAYGYPYGQAPPAQAFQAPQQAYYQTPAQSDVFAALAQAPPVYAPPPAPVYVAPPAPPAALASAKFGDETWRISGSDYLGLDLFRSLTDDKGLVISHVPACVEKKFHGAFVLNRRVDLHAIAATPARWRGDAGSLPLDQARTAASSPRNDLVENYRVHPTHWLISTQTVTTSGSPRVPPAARAAPAPRHRTADLPSTRARTTRPRGGRRRRSSAAP